MPTRIDEYASGSGTIPVARSRIMKPSRTRVEVARTPRGWSVTGEIDAGTCTTLAEAFAQLPAGLAGAIELDLAGVTFMDSRGLHVLIELATRVANSGGNVVIRSPARPVRRLLAITNLEALFGLDASDRPE
jgi:anti-anti-sigma factor